MFSEIITAELDCVLQRALLASHEHVYDIEQIWFEHAANHELEGELDE